MPKFAANLSMMYQEHAFLDRFGAAAKDGFKGVEFLFPYDFTAADIKARLDQHALTLALFNCPPGDWTKGERGVGSLPGREADFRIAFEKALAYADVLGNKRLHVMAGLMQPGKSRAEHRATYVKNLAWAAQQLGSRDLILVIEPINTRTLPTMPATSVQIACASSCRLRKKPGMSRVLIGSITKIKSRVPSCCAAHARFFT